MVQKQCWRALAPKCHQRTGPNRIGRGGVAREAPERYDAFLASLSQEPHGPRSVIDLHQVDVIHVQANHFADSRAGTVQNLQQRAIAQCCGRISHAGRHQEVLHVLDRDGLRQSLGHLGGWHTFSRICARHTLKGQEPVKAAYRHQGPGR